MSKNPKVLVQQGWLQGERRELVTGDGYYYSFKGVPYAEPPVGTLRFKAPQPPLPWTGIRKATQHGPICPQYNSLTHKLLPGEEDCLYLNVYTSNLTPQKPVPVMVFIHGGLFKFGSGNDDNYGPDFLVKQDVVLVTINYRLEVLGFLCLDTEEVPGNAGLKDQVAALRWIKNNIEKFGGDPWNTTIFGESAGGASTTFHILSPLSKGLFNRAVAMSGVALADWALTNECQRRAFTLGKLLGLDTKDPTELLEFLQSLPVEQLINKHPALHEFEEMCNKVIKMNYFAPVIEKDFGQDAFLTAHPVELLKNGEGSDIDLMIGYTNEEGLLGCSSYELFILPVYSEHPELFAPFRIFRNNTPEKIWQLSHRIREYYFGDQQIDGKVIREFVSYVSDCIAVFDTHNFANLLTKSTNSRRYFYRFCCVSERNIYGIPGLKFGITGAAHTDDMVYLFDPKFKNLKIEVNSKEYKMIDLSCKVFTNFAKYGNPTPNASLGVKWPEYNNYSRNHVDITDTLTLGTNLNADVLAFWKTIFDEAKIYADI